MLSWPRSLYPTPEIMADGLHPKLMSSDELFKDPRRILKADSSHRRIAIFRFFGTSDFCTPILLRTLHVVCPPVCCFDYVYANRIVGVESRDRGRAGGPESGVRRIVESVDLVCRGFEGRAVFMEWF